MADHPIYWNPQTDYSACAPSQLETFWHEAEAVFAKKFPTYSELHAWSCSQFQDFWSFWLRRSGLIFKGDERNGVYHRAPGAEFFAGRWFGGVKINYAQNLMAHIQGRQDVLVGLDETGRRIRWSGDQIWRDVALVQSYLKQQGVKAGDRVAGFLPNIPQAVVAMLATTGLGAVWSSCSPDFGAQGVLDRFGQIKPKVLFVADGYFYGGKTFSLEERNEALRAALPTVTAMHEVPFLANPSGWGSDLIPSLGTISDPEFVLGSFSDPLFILYSSGTTGTPKCIVHSVGGTLLQHTKEHKLHGDLRAGDRILYFTTTGWMMWNWLVSALAVGASVYCYEGSPAFPDVSVLWKWVEQEKISAFGTSARFIHSCSQANFHANDKMNLENLKVVFSTGSPLMPEDFDYFYSKICPSTRKIPLASISGGTDIISCFMLGNPKLPVRRGQIQGLGLGMDVQAWDETGKPVVGVQGELVCARPFPSMPIYFWDDPDHKKYRAAYFERYKDIWWHGDYVTITHEGGIVIHGRSDTTLNPGGVRIGTAEIYRQVEVLPEIEDSLAIGLKIDGDEKVLLFVKIKSSLNDLQRSELISKLKLQIKSGASPRHVPHQILFVKDIPYTISGKKVEKAISDLINFQKKPTNLDSLRNPESLTEYSELARTLGRT